MGRLGVSCNNGALRRMAMLGVAIFCAVAATGAAKDAGEEIAVPSFAGPWAHNGAAFDFAGPPMGVSPGPMVNISGDRLVPVGNYDSPLLKPWAAAEVKKHGDILLSGKLASDAHTQCDPMGVPYVLQARDNVWLLQTPDWVTIVYQNGSQRREVHLNAQHSANPAPSWFGESVGHYEGNTLVIDTIGIAVHDVSAIDRFGTPHTNAMHVVERYRISDDRRTMRVDFTVDDAGTFNMPWHASVSYGRGTATPGEYVCAENNNDYFHEGIPLPLSEKPDF